MPASNHRESLLDLLRIMACLLVVFHHAAIALIFGEDGEVVTPILVQIQSSIIWLTSIGQGTPVFFVLAGWLVMNTLEKTDGSRNNILHSFTRRMKRILPAYWLALGLIALLFFAMDQYDLKTYYSGAYSAEFKSPSELTFWQWAGNVTLTETWRSLYTADEPIVFTRSAWALCYHEQFVAIAFLIALIAGKKWRQVLLPFTFLIIGWQIILYDSGSFHRAEGLFVDRWFCFAAGILAFQIKRAHTSRSMKQLYFVVLLAGLLTSINIADTELFLSSSAAILIVMCTDIFQRNCPDHIAEKLAKVSPWTYFIYLAHFPAVTICNRIMVEAGIRHFWARSFLLLPVSTLVGITAGLLFGQFVKWLEKTEIQPILAISECKRLIAKSHPLLRRIWREVAERPILLPSWNLFPRSGQAGDFAPLASARVQALSDQTPWPTAAP
jgi:peptidoglycan/LPS O-acetylase OafA/YrhL